MGGRGLKHIKGSEMIWHGHARKGDQSPEYRVWAGMLTRCYNENNKTYCRYGGRGITVCDRWRNSFLAFLEDMGPRPSLKHTLDRIDNNGNYEPGNCRWATMIEQARNKSTSLWLELGGVSRPAMEWCELAGTDYHAFYWRYENGWPPHECVWGRPLKKLVYLTHGGETRTIDEWALHLGISRHTIASRHSYKKWPDEWCLFGRDGNQKTQPKRVKEPE